MYYVDIFILANNVIFFRTNRCQVQFLSNHGRNNERYLLEKKLAKT